MEKPLQKRKKSLSSSSPSQLGQVNFSQSQYDGYVIMLDPQVQENQEIIEISDKEDNLLESNSLDDSQKNPYWFKLTQKQKTFLNQRYFTKCKKKQFDGENFYIQKGISLQIINNLSSLEHKQRKKLKKKSKLNIQDQDWSSSSVQQLTRGRGKRGRLFNKKIENQKKMLNLSRQSSPSVEQQNRNRGRKGRNDIILNSKKNQKQLTLEQSFEKQPLHETLKKVTQIFKILKTNKLQKIFEKIPTKQDSLYKIWSKITDNNPINFKIIQSKIHFKHYKNYIDFHLDILHMIQNSYIFHTVIQNQDLKKQTEQFQRFFWQTFNKLVVPWVNEQIVSKVKTKLIKMKRKDSTEIVKEIIDMEDSGNKFKIENLNKYFKQIIEKDPQFLTRYKELIQKYGEEATVKIVENTQIPQFKIQIKQISKDLFKSIRLMTKSKIDNIRKEQLQERVLFENQQESSDDFSVDSSSSDSF